MRGDVGRRSPAAPSCRGRRGTPGSARARRSASPRVRAASVSTSSTSVTLRHTSVSAPIACASERDQVGPDERRGVPDVRDVVRRDAAGVHAQRPDRQQSAAVHAGWGCEGARPPGSAPRRRRRRRSRRRLDAGLLEAHLDHAASPFSGASEVDLRGRCRRCERLLRLLLQHVRRCSRGRSRRGRPRDRRARRGTSGAPAPRGTPRPARAGRAAPAAPSGPGARRRRSATVRPPPRAGGHRSRGGAEKAAMSLSRRRAWASSTSSPVSDPQLLAVVPGLDHAWAGVAPWPPLRASGPRRCPSPRCRSRAR